MPYTTTPSKRKPHRDWAGYVTERRNPLSGGHNVLVRAGPAQLDPSGGTWVTVCDVHGSLCNHHNRQLAYAHLVSSEWCEDCMAIRDRRENPEANRK
jgi:hypothetical protein